MFEITTLNNMLQALEQGGQFDENSRVVYDARDGLVLAGGTVRALQFRSSASKAANTDIRQRLLDAVAEKFEGVANIPESVKQAMKLDETASGYSLSSDGTRIKVGNKPLTLRRIRAILTAAENARSTAETKTVFSPRETLAALTGPALDRAGLQKSLGALQEGLEKLCRCGELLPMEMDRAAEGRLAAAVQGLTNKELLAAFHTLGTEEFLDFRETLPNDARCNLFALDGLIVREMGHRALQAIAPAEYQGESTVAAHGGGVATEQDVARHVDAHDLSARNMMALANVEVVGNAHKAKVADEFVRTKVPATALAPEDFQRVGDMMRNAPLTLNVKAGYFFSENGPLSFLGGTWKNLFHFQEEGVDVKGAGYLAKRNQVETAFYPEFGTGAQLSARERPTYAALNLRGGSSGEASLYGSVVLKLKPEVKRRAVFTVNDSFTLPITVNDERLAVFRRAVLSLDGLSNALRAELGRAGSPAAAALEEALGKLQAAPKPNANDADFDIPGATETECQLLTAALIDCCKTVGQPRKGNTATYDNLERLLPNLTHVETMQLVHAARAGTSASRLLSNYIEAQIHGDLRFPDDVEEITVSETYLNQDCPELSDQCFVKAAIAVLSGQEIEAGSPLDRHLSAEQKGRLSALREALNGRTVKITFASDRQISRDAEDELARSVQAKAFAFTHFDQAQAQAAIDAAVRDGAACSKLLSAADPRLQACALGDTFTLSPALAARLKDRIDYYAAHRDEVPTKGNTAFEAIVRQELHAVVGEKMFARLDVLLDARQPVTSEMQAVARAVLDGAKMSRAEMFRRAGVPEHPAFPPAARPDALPQTFAARRQFLLDLLPVYAEHEKPGHFDHGAGTHGRGHICRAFIFAEAMANIMAERGYAIDRAALAMGIAGHDSGRTVNGADTAAMEGASAATTLEQARANYGADALGADYEKAFTDCIVGHKSATLEGVLLNSADSLDIGRTKDFDFKYFPFLRVDGKTGAADTPEDDALRHDLQKEAQLLAILTDPHCESRRWVEALFMEGRPEEAVLARRTATTDMEKLQAEPDSARFFQWFEDALRTHPQSFPLLTRYYLDCVPQPTE